MPRLVIGTPAYSQHKASGQAVVTLNGRDIYLGRHGSPESRSEYDRVVGEWLASGRREPPRSAPSGYTVNEILLAFLRHAKSYYRRADGSQTSEYDNFRDAIRPLERLYGHTAAESFGPLALKTVREEMIRLGWCRTNINKQIGRLKRIFKYAVENEMLGPAVHQALQAVPGLRAGRSAARESQPVTPVADTVVDATLPHVSNPVQAMIQLQQLTGMRPGEVILMRGGDIDRSEELWVYVPAQHKTAHHGHAREIYLGPRAQDVLRPFLHDRDLAAYLFSPAEAEAERRARRHAARRTPRSCGNRPGTNRKMRPQRRPGNRYTVESYCRAVANGARKADAEAHAAHPEVSPEMILVPRWHPNQLRHSAATRLRKQYGLESAQVIVGHRTLGVTQVYAERNTSAARTVVAAVG